MAREARSRLRAALDPGPNPYEHLDRVAATRLGGAMYLVGFAFAGIVLPLSPPSGPLGWAGVLACMALAVVMGIGFLRMRGPAHPNVLLAGSYVGLVAAIVFRASAGPGAPFEQLLFIAAIYTCTVHPARRVFPVLLLASAATLTPLLYEPAGPAFSAQTVSQLALTWGVGLIVLIWMTNVRRQRGVTAAERDQADRLARIDPLTGMSNRRALEEALPVAVAAARRSDRPLSVLVADLDNFKGVNDTFGHQTGDEMLRGAARGITTALRISDPCFRWGGDEFVALLPDTTAEGAREVAGRIATTVALSVRHPDGRPLRITLGAAELGDGDTGADLLERADAELLEAKARRRARAARAS